MQRCVIAEPGGRFQIGAGIDEHLGHHDTAVFRRPVQGGHAVPLSGVCIDALFEQRAHRVDVISHGRVGHGGGGG